MLTILKRTMQCAVLLALLICLPAARTAQAQTAPEQGCPTDWNYQIVPSPFFESDETLFLVDEREAIAWRSTDNAINWTRIVSQAYPYNSGIGSFVIAPIPLSTGLPLYSHYYYGTFGLRWTFAHSADSGDTWEEWDFGCENCSGLHATNQQGVLFWPRYEYQIGPFVFEHGIFRSDDDGLTWQNLWTETGASRVVSSPDFADDQTLFAMVDRFIISTDGGYTWEARSDGFCEDERIRDVSLSPDFTNDQTLFAKTNFHSLQKSEDGGRTWQYLYPPDEPPCEYHYNGVLRVHLSPDYPSDRTVYIDASDALLVSYDDGHTWRRLRNGRTYGFSVHRRPTPVSRFIYLPLVVSAAETPVRHQLHLPLVAGRGTLPISRPYTIFVELADVHLRSDDGGVTWQCLNLPPVQP